MPTGAAHFSGSCLCRSCVYQIDGGIEPAGVCHCEDCRKVTGGPFGDANALYADLAGDEFFASNPLPLRVRLYFSAFVFGPVTLALMIGFLRGWNRIRPLALMYAGAMIIGVLEFFAWEWASGAPATRPAVLVAFNGPYLLVPVLLAVRMWRDEPFGRVETSTE